MKYIVINKSRIIRQCDVEINDFVAVADKTVETQDSPHCKNKTSVIL